MTPTQSATGRRRRVFVPAPPEWLPPPQLPDPPIYRALMRTWADRGRTLPGRHDPEWARLAAPPAGVNRRGTGQAPFSATRDQPGDGR
ncbi:hypothetical protein [Streptomyces sp. TP-A0356]|uniref:hypothetical protein n=1 Tax=Streptomyces sp. TP-A0356 TaxID=1359208 RepID=UPI00099EDC24|nr:hypothetical protein [Streptomyces sp. TP-A0356]